MVTQMWASQFLPCAYHPEAASLREQQNGMNLLSKAWGGYKQHTIRHKTIVAWEGARLVHRALYTGPGTQQVLNKWEILALIELDCTPREAGGRLHQAQSGGCGSPCGLTCLNTLCCSKSPQLEFELSASRQRADAATEQSWKTGDQKTLQSAGNGNSDKDWLPGAGWRGSKCDYKKPACSQRAASSLLRPSISRLQTGGRLLFPPPR